MVTGQLKQDGQIYTLHDTKGYLKNIEVDLDYVPESTGENLDSLVRTNAFWCFLKEEEGTGLFKTILYRKTVENKIMVLGGETSPEKTKRNSMRAYGDYVYYLPKVKESQLTRLSEAEKGLYITHALHGDRSGVHEPRIRFMAQKRSHDWRGANGCFS